jgi:hypothetical protein
MPALSQTLIFAANSGTIHRGWFLLPLIIVISLVYSASRYESPGTILRRAGRLSLTIAGFMGLVLAVLVWLSHGL